MSHHCPNCGYLCGNPSKLSDWERAELHARALRVMAEHPPARGRIGTRQHELNNLAADYDITLRTLYRYLREAA